jgi:hypothetical protein
LLLRSVAGGDTSGLELLGLFPEVGEDTLIAPGLVLAAERRELTPSEDAAEQFGVDVARYGKDETMIYRARGGVVRLEWHGHL